MLIKIFRFINTNFAILIRYNEKLKGWSGSRFCVWKIDRRK